ncbi:unnamed protein product [Rotaria socialis]|uniref:HNH nuclease domain-containing protein n=1 Tax=Rotaria socialis TaxID=392032 RepID=A0A821W1S1_9BILA|nr:unnamed protein product [Rotaria socialis]CAF4918782.1 unnamed protein product [Rotaria socialis]
MMYKTSRQHNRDVFKSVQEELLKLGIEREQNDIELVLNSYNFDLNKTINAFKNGTTNDILCGWKLSSKKKNMQEQSKTSTPKKKDTANLTQVNVHDTSISTSEDISNKEETCSDGYDPIKNIAICEKSIKEYESLMKTCNDSILVDYYVKSAMKLREQISLLLEIYNKKFMNDKLSEQVKCVSEKLNYLLKQNNVRLKENLDCWESSSSRTKDEQDDFKNKLIIYYKCGAQNMKQIKCMVLNKWFDRCIVRASHIWKAATKGVGLNEFQLHESDIHNERNGLLLYESIEKAFDSKKLCFIYNPFAGTLQVKILCNDLKKIYIVDDAKRKNFNEFRTFNDIDNAVLNLPIDVFPYRRLLNWHGRCSYKTAKANKWMDENEHLEDFFHLSDLISLPGDDFDE